MDAWDQFLSLPVTCLTLQLEADRDLDEDRWWASTIRGGFGCALRFLLCRCRSASHKPSCTFARFFAPNSDGLTESGPSPSPWRLVVEKIGQRTLNVELFLYGPATGYEEECLLALKVAGTRGLAEARMLCQVQNRLQGSLVQMACQPFDERAILVLQSPLRLLQHGQPIAITPSFSQLLAAAQRRVRLAARAWAAASIPYPSDHLRWAKHVWCESIELQWVDRGRYSQRQQRPMHLGGLLGRLRFAGSWSFAWPWLRLLPVLGLGKLTTMGFGQVRWEQNSDC